MTTEQKLIHFEAHECRIVCKWFSRHDHILLLELSLLVLFHTLVRYHYIVIVPITNTQHIRGHTVTST